MFAAILASSLVILSICEMKCNQIEPLNKKQIEKKRNFVEFRIFFFRIILQGEIMNPILDLQIERILFVSWCCCKVHPPQNIITYEKLKNSAIIFKFKKEFKKWRRNWASLMTPIEILYFFVRILKLTVE